MTAPAPPAAGAGRGLGGRSTIRAGASRLTSFGALVLVCLVIGVGQPPNFADRQILVLIWVAMLAAFAVGTIWPLVAVRQIAIAASSPRDATVGDEVPIDVDVTGRFGSCEVRALDPAGSWHRVDGPGTGSLRHEATMRGVFQVIRIEVRVTAPLGILSAGRIHQVPLPHAVEVAPRPLAVDWLPAPAPLDGGVDPAALAALGGDLVRAVRPYAPGDPAHLVHWPSTARTGTLVVRELEPPAPIGQAIVVDLRDLGPDKERAASYAMGAARAVLAAGGELVLCTSEVQGPRTARVRAPIEAGRRLARAVAAEPGAPPEGWSVVEIGR